MATTQQKGFILHLNKMGFNVVEIEDEVFVMLEFNEATGNVNKHHLVGKDITDISHNYPTTTSLDNLAMQGLQQKIDMMPKYNRGFSGHFKWKTYLSR